MTSRPVEGLPGACGRPRFVSSESQPSTSSSMPGAHIQDELLANSTRVTVQTRNGPVTGGKADNGAIAFLGIAIVLSQGAFVLNSAQKYPMPCLQGDLKIPSRCRPTTVTKRRNMSLRAPVSFGRMVCEMRAEDPWSDGVQPLNDGQAAGEGCETPSYRS